MHQTSDEIFDMRKLTNDYSHFLHTSVSSFPLAEFNHLSLSLTLRALFKHGHCQHEHEVAHLTGSWFTGPLAPAWETPSHLVAQIGKSLCPVAITNIFEPWWCSHTNISCCAQHPRLTVFEWKRKPAFYHSSKAVGLKVNQKRSLDAPDHERVMLLTPFHVPLLLLFFFFSGTQPHS